MVGGCDFFLGGPGGGRDVVINWYKASGYIVYLLVNSILKITLHLQMLSYLWTFYFQCCRKEVSFSKNKKFLVRNMHATNVINWYKASWYTVYLLVNSLLKIALQLQMLNIVKLMNWSTTEYNRVQPSTTETTQNICYIVNWRINKLLLPHNLHSGAKSVL